MNKNSVIHLLISTDSLKKYDWNSYIIKVISLYILLIKNIFLIYFLSNDKINALF